MDCLNPYLLEDYGIKVPCGHCIHCRIARAREWATRIVHESFTSEYGSVFLTLTYAPEFYPKDESISKRELQLFFKRLRRSFDDRKIRYYACGEYGDLRRAHYHACVFNIGFAELQPYIVYRKKGVPYYTSDRINEIWGLGFTVVGLVTYDSGRYVADYVQKKYNGLRALLCYGKKEVPFQLQSKGLGYDFLSKNADQIKANMNITIQGRNCGLPRYYKKKLGLTTAEMAPLAIEKAEEVRELYSHIDGKELFDTLQKMRYQKKKNILAQDSSRHKSV